MTTGLKLIKSQLRKQDKLKKKVYMLYWIANREQTLGLAQAHWHTPPMENETVITKEILEKHETGKPVQITLNIHLQF